MDALPVERGREESVAPEATKDVVRALTDGHSGNLVGDVAAGAVPGDDVAVYPVASAKV